MEEIGYVILQIFVLLVFAKILGRIFEKFGLPGLVGEILAGVIFINVVVFYPNIGHAIEFDVNDFFAPDNTHFLHVMGELGIIFLLFIVGLETKFSDLVKVGRPAMYVAVLGLVIPLIGGFLFLVLPSVDWRVALLIGTAMFAMSTGIAIEVLRKLDAMRSVEAKIIIGAAVIDDILCLTLLAIISGVVAPNADITSIIANTVIVIVFILVMFLGISRIKAIADRRRRRLIEMKRRAGRIAGDLIIGASVGDHHESKPVSELSALSLAIIVCLGLSAVSITIGLAGIIGAFLAGMIFAEFKETIPCEHNFSVVTSFLLPFFFIWVGMQVRLDLVELTIVPILCALVIVAVITKYAGGYFGARLGKLQKDSSELIGVSMIPRGEVGIIVATIGLNLGVFTSDIFTAVILMTLATSIIAPPLISKKYKNIQKNRIEAAAVAATKITEVEPEDSSE